LTLDTYRLWLLPALSEFSYTPQLANRRVKATNIHGLRFVVAAAINRSKPALDWRALDLKSRRVLNMRHQFTAIPLVDSRTRKIDRLSTSDREILGNWLV
jgi:hypothetical protein